ncbi:MAG: hypothetical protein MAG715_00222 [Methanonatronarchaeales archaeon]|nr:hypothetical protein [Methanonatronarchaeales archaeon]
MRFPELCGEAEDVVYGMYSPYRERVFESPKAPEGDRDCVDCHVGGAPGS